MWFDDYFWIGDYLDDFVRVRVRRGYGRCDMGGTAPKQKQVQPEFYGEKRDDPVRTLLVLRGWVLWRARVCDWATERPCRAKRFAEHAALLERDVRSLKATDRLLGDTSANDAFAESVPDIVARFLATGGAPMGIV